MLPSLALGVGCSTGWRAWPERATNDWSPGCLRPGVANRLFSYCGTEMRRSIVSRRPDCTRYWQVALASASRPPRKNSDPRKVPARSTSQPLDGSWSRRGTLTNTRCCLPRTSAMDSDATCWACAGSDWRALHLRLAGSSLIPYSTCLRRSVRLLTNWPLVQFHIESDWRRAGCSPFCGCWAFQR